jgi:hypothetical protein
MPVFFFLVRTISYAHIFVAIVHFSALFEKRHILTASAPCIPSLEEFTQS